MVGALRWSLVRNPPRGEATARLALFRWRGPGKRAQPRDCPELLVRVGNGVAWQVAPMGDHRSRVSPGRDGGATAEGLGTRL